MTADRLAPSAPSTFPRQQARTRRFSLGRPRNIRVAADGSRVAFLRSGAGDDAVNCLWVIDMDGFDERMVIDPRGIEGLALDEEDLAPAERSRRERVRESAGGIVAYGADRLLTKAAFTLAGELFVTDLSTGGTQRLAAPGPVVDPRPDPTGRRIAYVCDRALHVVDDDGSDAVIAGEAEAGTDGDVGWGLAEFIAAEEMGRSQGYWWSPEGNRLAVARVDNGPVSRWHLSDPADPSVEPAVVCYPAAGTDNAAVSLHLAALDGSAVEVDWDRHQFPYLATVTWDTDSPLTLLVQSRDQRSTKVLLVDLDTGATTTCREDHDGAWVDLVAGAPRWTPAGELVTCAYVDDVMRVLVDGRPISPVGVQVRGVVDVGDDVVVTGSEDPTDVHVWRCSIDGGAPPRLVTPGPGLHGVAVGGDVTVVVSSTLEPGGLRVTVRSGDEVAGTIASLAATPAVDPRPAFFNAGPRSVRAALLLPRRDTGAKLPVVVDPYGGPGHQRVVHTRSAFAESQWLADQGFAVVVADGRGTGGRGRAWDREVHLDLAGPVLEDQIAALHEAAGFNPQLDLDRVAIRGWSFGGYLAALAVLRRPDVFSAAVAGAPVTDWLLYDTHYTERYLGHPDANPESYERSSLIADAPKLIRPLLLIHGISDDNVVFAHTLRLSRALFEAGRDHEVLPLAGITHMTPQEVVAENLLLAQVRFIKRALGVAAD